jgi:hypothetical protein
VCVMLVLLVMAGRLQKGYRSVLVNGGCRWQRNIIWRVEELGRV